MSPDILLPDYTNLLDTAMQCAFDMIWRLTGLKRLKEFAEQRWKDKVSPWQRKVRRIRGRTHSPCGSLIDSVVEAWIIRGMLWVSVVITLLRILNMQWDILGRRAQEQAKGQLCRRTCQVPTKICKRAHVCVQRAELKCEHMLISGRVFTCMRGWLLLVLAYRRYIGWVWPW